VLDWTLRHRTVVSSTVPRSTYRLQLNAEFGFADAADLAGYLARLGVTHAYVSPILQAAPGSRHGYDVVDHSRVSAELGGEDGFRYLAGHLARHGVGLVVDVVPNHMAIPVPEYLNRELWSVLADGQQSPRAHWFDVDWAVLDGRMLLPILTAPPMSCLDDFKVSRLAELPGAAAVVGDDAPVLQYQGHVLPLRAGTERLPLPDLLAAQHYRLESWRSAATDLNWRRFFDVSTLIAVRVEEPDVFAATHGLLLGLVAEELIDGLRIDHPDGLADPRAYLGQLQTAAGGRWIVAEKILATGEQLESDWTCAGTTGYDALAAVGAVLTDPAGAERLSTEYTNFSGDSSDFASVARAAKRQIASQYMAAEIARLARLIQRLDEPALALVRAEDLGAIIAELLAAFTVYRSYVVPGEPPPATSIAAVCAAAAASRERLAGDLHAAVDTIAALLLGRGVAAGLRSVRDELIVRFQQTCAAVQAKGVEDTAAYRWTRLVSANEVGADPDLPAMSTATFHAFARRLADNWPATMTTLSTHDTKRQEDVRARLAVLAEIPAEWAREMMAWHDRASQLARTRPPDPPTEYLLWQTLVGAWPISANRLAGYLRKAMREAKLTTSWTEPDADYEEAVISFAQHALTDAELSGRIESLVASIGTAAQANSLSGKLLQLTMPGVPDIYQGCELAGLALVDPDNRRPVDYERRQAMLATLAGDAASAAASLDAAKLLVTSRTLRLRRVHPDWFAGDYQPLHGSGSAAAHVVAFCRAERAVTVATRLPRGLARDGGWRDTALRLAPGRWHDVLTDADYHVGTGGHAGLPPDRLPLADLLAQLPVALLIRANGASPGQASVP
jgi:(1->4)-alpha-D-glucan 1-alpha-D-glucosylmutase